MQEERCTVGFEQVGRGAEGCVFMGGFVLLWPIVQALFLVFQGMRHRCHNTGGIRKLHEHVIKLGRNSEIIKSNPVLLTSMTKVVHGTVHKGMIKPVDMLEENEEVLIIRVQKPKKSTIDMIVKKPRKMLNHSFVEEIIESTESGEGID